MKKSSLMFYVGMAVSLAFLGWAVAKLDFARAFGSMLRLDPLWLVPYLSTYLLLIWLRAARLRLITSAVKEVPMQTLVSSICIGFMGNMVFPLRIGEFIRVYVVAKKERVSQSGILATIVVERVFDIFATAMLVVVAIFYARPLAVDASVWRNVEQAAAVFGAVSAAAGVFLFFIAGEKGFALGFVNGFIGLLPPRAAARAGELLTSFRGGLQMMRNTRHLAAAVAQTVVLYAAAVASSCLVFPLFGMPGGFDEALILCIFTIVGVAVPSAPGAVGTYHAGVVFALTLYGADASTALGVAIFLHFFMFTFYLVSGSWYLMRNKMTFAELRHTADA